MAESPELHVADGNAEQAQGWDGPGGEFWASRADTFDRTVRRYQPRLVAAAGVRPDDRVLDVGCGAGRLSLDCAALATSGHVTGVDLSSPMLAVARQRAAEAALDNVEFVHTDVQAHPFAPASYDLAVSRNGTMFFSDPVAAFTRICGALGPGGRLVMMVWQGPEPNEWLRVISSALAADGETPPMEPDAPGPLGLSDPDRLRGILTSAGFTDVDLESVVEPTSFGDTLEEAVAFVTGLGRGMLAELDDPTRARVLDDLRSVLADHQTPDGVELGSAAWFVRARGPRNPR